MFVNGYGVGSDCGCRWLLMLASIIVFISTAADEARAQISVGLNYLPTEIAGYSFGDSEKDSVATRIAEYYNQWGDKKDQYQKDFDAFLASLSKSNKDAYNNVLDAIDKSTDLPDKLDNDNFKDMWNWNEQLVGALPCDLAASVINAELPLPSGFEDQIRVQTGTCGSGGDSKSSSGTPVKGSDGGILITGTRTVTVVRTVKVTLGEATETESSTVTSTVVTDSSGEEGTGTLVTAHKTTTLTIGSDGETLNPDIDDRGSIIYIPPSETRGPGKGSNQDMVTESPDSARHALDFSYFLFVLPVIINVFS
ncbi:hypothetical protein H4219_002901 [Mycoemilia scoparia]|uniref:Uncharacterized protein n=1 Tax=Mycoemilia scoparia TaxID=417184 RepID=A0A9W7ZX35_9FUNG|nr:hypothetical protein H4219_002901 [Mycoemilia scoparia]